MLAMRNLVVIILACAPVSAFRVRHNSKRTRETHDVGRGVPMNETIGSAQAQAPKAVVEYQLVAESSNLTGALSPRRIGGPSTESWLTDALKNLLADIAALFNSFLETLVDLRLAGQIVDYVIDFTCNTGNDCPVYYAECVSPYSLHGHRPTSRCSDIMSKEGTGLICASWNRNVYGYYPCWGTDQSVEDECEARCPSSMLWSDVVHLPKICPLYKDTFCPLLQSESSAAMRHALKVLAVKALHPDAWIPEDASGQRTFNGWMSLVLKTLAGVGLAVPGTRNPSIYRGLFPELYSYKDCLAANNNVHEACKHHVEYDENPALKREAAYQLAVSVRGYNYQNSCRGENLNMANFGAVGLGIDISSMANWCKQSDKGSNAVHDDECVGIAGNVPQSRPREPVGNLEQSSCDGVNWATMEKVYDADLGVCLGKDGYSPLKVWKHEGLLSDTQVGLYMTEEGTNKVKLTLNNRGSELPDLSALPASLASEDFEASALWRQLPEAIKDWLFTDFLIYPSDDSICGDGNVKVHTGFQNAYKTFKNYTRTQNPAGQSYLDEVAAIITAKMAAGKEVELYISGHSLGAALAVVMAYDIYCHQSDSSHASINSVLTFSKNSAANKATGPLIVTFGEAPVWWGKRSAAGFAAAVPASVHMRVNTCGQETTESGTFYSGDLVGLAMDHSTDDDQGFRKRADSADFQCAWVSKTFFARASSTGLDSASMTEPGTVISPATVDQFTSSSCAGALVVGGVSVFDSAIFCHFGDRYMEGMVNDRGVENSIAANSSVPRKSLFHSYNRPKADTRATCQDLGTYSYDGESYADVPQVLAEYALRNVVSDILNIPLGEIFDRLAARTAAVQSVLGDVQAKYDVLNTTAEGLFSVDLLYGS